MGTPWRRFLTPARCGQTTSRIARPNSDDDGSGSPSLGEVTCASGTQLHVGAGDRRVVTAGSAASNDARCCRWVGAVTRAYRVGSTRPRRTVGVRPHRSRWTQGGSRGRKRAGRPEQEHETAPPIAGCGCGKPSRCCRNAQPAAANISTEPQAREGPPSFRGRTVLGADHSAKGDA